MAQQTRHLTSEEIDRVMSDILEDMPELKEREEKLADLRKLLIDKRILVNITTELANIIGNNSDAKEKLEAILLTLTRQNNIIPNIVKEINETINEPLNESDKLNAAINYIVQRNIFSEDKIEDINRAIYVEPYDYKILVMKLLEILGPNDPYKNEIEQIYNANSDQPDLLIGALEFYISKIRANDQNIYVKTLEMLEDILNGTGSIYDSFRISKIMELEYVANDNNIMEILTNNEPTDDLKIFRLVEYLRGHQNLDVPEWLIQLLEGEMNVFVNVRNKYDLIMKILSEEEDDAELSLSDENGEELDKAVKSIVNVIINSDNRENDMNAIIAKYKITYNLEEFIKISVELSNSLVEAAETFRRFLESSKVIGQKKFDWYTLLETIIIMKKDNISTDFRNRALRATLEEVEISDIDEFVNNYKSNKPRYLTDEEIRYILSSLPMPMGDKDIAASSRQAIGLTLQQELRDIKITPLAIDDLRERIKSRFNKARQIQGQTVGAQAASGMGSMVTQMTLNSVDWDEIVYIRNGENVILGEIGKFVDDIIDKSSDVINNENETEYVNVSDEKYEVTCVDEDGKMYWKKLEAVTRHLPGGQMVKIKTRSGRTVTATKSKSFLVRVDNKIVPKKGSDMVVGDRVPVVINSAKTNNELYKVDMKKYFPKSSYVYGSEIIKMDDGGDIGKVVVPSGIDCKIYKELINKNKEYIDKIIYKVSDNEYSTIPEYFELNEETGFFIGAYIAGGKISGDYVKIRSNDKTCSNKIKLLCNKYNIKCVKFICNESYSSLCMGLQEGLNNISNKTPTDIIINSSMICTLLKNLCGDKIKKFPDWSIISNINFVKGLVDGYLSMGKTADYDYCYEHNSFEIIVSSAHKEINKGLSELLMRFGIFSNILEDNVLIVKSPYINKLNSCVKLTSEYLNVFETLLYNSDMCIAQDENDIIPGMNTKLHKGDINREIIKNSLLLDIDNDERKLLELAVNSDVYYDEIISIEEVNSSHKKVYDFSVEDTRNFTIYGGLCVRDTFHKAGSALNVTSGIERTNELINVKTDPKSASTTIYYEAKLPFEEAKSVMESNTKPSPDVTKNIGYSFDEILNKRTEVVGITVSDLFINDPEIDRYDNIMDPVPRWYRYYNAINGTNTPESTWVMRLRLNPLIMFKYNICIEDVASAITSGTWMDPNVCQAVQCINVVYSPNGTGIIDSDEIIINKNGTRKQVQIPVIDIFPVENLLNQVLKDMTFPAGKNSFNFLNRIVEPSFKSIYVQGVNSIKQAFVEKYPVWESVSHFRKVGVNDKSFKWKIYLKENIVKQRGINNTHVARLCWAAGMAVDTLSEDGAELTVSTPKGYTGDPGKLVSSSVSDDASDASNYQEEKINKKIIPSRRPDTEISSAAHYYYIATIGSNLRRILMIPGVDYRRTYSNHPAEDASVFGIESGRNYQLTELVRVFSQDGDLPINLRHVLLLTDFMTVHGELVPLTYSGMGRQSVGFMTKATYEHAMDSISSAALSQAKEKVGGVSVSITVGKLAKIGTGSVDIVIDRQKIQDQLSTIDDLVFDEKAFEQTFKDINSSDMNPVTRDADVDFDSFDDTDFNDNINYGLEDSSRFSNFGNTQFSTEVSNNIPVYKPQNINPAPNYIGGVAQGNVIMPKIN